MARKFLTAIDLAKNELQNAVVQNLAAAPSSPVKGQLYFDTSTNTLYWHNGTSWVAASPGTGFPGYGSVTQEQTFGAAKTDGVATTVARSDHGHGNPVHDNAAHSAINLNALAAPTAAVNMNGQVVQNVGAPSSGTDAANKTYVDNLSAGLAWKDTVRAATTANITLSGTQTIDGVALIANDRVLVKNQSTASANGIYLVQAGAWTRATDSDNEADLLNAAVFVSEGTTLADTAWVCTTNAPITVGTTSLAFAQFASTTGSVPVSTTLTAGAGLTGGGDLSTNRTFDVGAGTGITVAADSVALDTAYTDGRYALATATVKRYTVDVGGATSQVLTHNLNTLDCIIQLYRKASPFDQIECDVEHTSVNTATVRFTTAPAAAEYRAVVLA